METFTREQYDTFTEIVRNNSGHPRDDYSGRFMYGKTCLAADFDYYSDWVYALKDLMDTFEDMDWGQITSDSMGLGTVYYWRGVSVEPAEEE